MCAFFKQGYECEMTVFGFSSYLWLTTWILVEIDFPEVVSTGQDLLVVGAADIVHIRAISSLWPNSWKVQSSIKSFSVFSGLKLVW